MASPILEQVPQHAWEPNRKRLVTAKYIQFVKGGGHGGMEPSAEALATPVTENGVQIEMGGEKLTLGMVPLENRYAIGPIVDGHAEVLRKDEFESLHQQAFLEFFAAKGVQPVDPANRFVPSVREFVAQKEDPLNPKKLVPLGTDYVPSIVPDAKREFWSEAGQRMVPVEEVRDLQEEENAALKARLAALEARLAGDPIEPVADVKPKETAPCGKEITQGFLKQHKNFCKDEACAEPDLT